MLRVHIACIASCCALAAASGCGDDDGDAADRPQGRRVVSEEAIAKARSDERFVRRARHRCGGHLPARAGPSAGANRVAAAADRRAEALRRRRTALRAAGEPKGGADAVAELHDMLDRAAQLEDRAARAARSKAHRAAARQISAQAEALGHDIARRARKLGFAECGE